ncbi:MAG: hypothetical protein WBF53_04215, partial [Litorimonas sp.]
MDLGGKTIKGVCAIDIVASKDLATGTDGTSTIIHAAGRVGGSTGIIRSVDSGETWSVIDMTPHAGMILDVKFFDENEGLVFASTGTDVPTTHGLVLRTTNGGQDWSEVYRGSRPQELVWKASFPNRLTGFATIQSY